MTTATNRTIARGILGVALILQGACAARDSRAVSPTVPFKGLFEQIHVTPLRSPVGQSIGFASEALVTNTEIALVDRAAFNIKVFARRDGSLSRVVGKAGNDAGDFRNPTAVALLDSGRYVVYDQARRALSFRDSLGRLIDETLAPRGVFSGLVALPAEHRFVLAGRMSNQTGDTKDVDLHEFDYGGKRLASYAPTASARSSLEKRFNTLFATQIGTTVVTGALNSNRLRLYDRATRHEKWIDVAPSWYRPLEYPPHAVLPQPSGKQGSPPPMLWAHTQPFMSGVFPLTGGRLLVRFQAFTSMEDKAFFYAVADTSGRTLAISQATRASVIATRADTVFWINGGNTRTVNLTAGVISGAP